MNYTVIFIALFYVAGVFTSGVDSSFFLPLTAIIGIAVTVIKYAAGRRRGVSLVVYLMVFTAAFFYAGGESIAENSDLYRFQDKYIEAAGRITEIPKRFEDTYQYTVKLHQASYDGETILVDDVIRITSENAFDYGESIYFEGFLEQFDEAENTGGYDAKFYNRTRGILYKLYTEDSFVLDQRFMDISLKNIVTHVRYSIYELIDKNFTEPYDGILKAIVIGYKNDIDNGTDEILLKTGVRRCLHPAFLHVWILVYVVSLISSRLDKNKRTIVMCICLILFAAVNSDKPLFIKSALIFGIGLAGNRKFGYISDADTVCTAVIAIGLINPLSFYNAGIVLSFTATVLYRKISEAVPYPVGRGKRIVHNIIVCNLMGVALAPLSLYYYNYFSVYSVLMSYVVLPMVICVLAVFPVYCIVHMLPLAGALVGNMIHLFINAIFAAAFLLYKTDISILYLPTPNIAFLIGFYLGLAALVFVIKNKKKTAFMYILPMALCFGICFGQYLYIKDKLQITFVNVGQGDGMLIKAPGGENIIIDGGGGAVYSNYNIGEEIFVPYLERNGAYNIDLAILSHYDKDHSEGVIAAVEKLKVGNIIAPDTDADSEYRKKLETAAFNADTDMFYVNKDVEVKLSDGLTIKIYAPQASEGNNASLTAELTYKGFKAFFSGDIEKEAEQELAASGKLSDVDLVKAAHHGSATSSTEEFVNTVLPEYTVISVGKDNTFSHPADITLERYGNGDITCIVDKEGNYWFRMLRVHSE